MGEKKKQKKKIKKLQKVIRNIAGGKSYQNNHAKGYIIRKMRKYRKIILLDIGFVLLAIVLFSPAFVGLSFTGSALHIAISASIAVAGCAAFVMANLDAFTAKQFLLTDHDTRSVQDLRKMFETLDRKDTLAEISKQALRQISQWDNTRKGYTEQIHRQFGAKTLTAAKYTGILDTMEDILIRNLMNIYNKYCLFDESEVQQLTNYQDDFIDDTIQEQKLKMYYQSLISMKQLLDDNERLLFEISRLMYKLSDLTPAQETSISDEVEKLVEELKYYRANM